MAAFLRILPAIVKPGVWSRVKASARCAHSAHFATFFIALPLRHFLPFA